MKHNVGPKERYGRIGLGLLSAVGAALLPVDTIWRVALGVMALAGVGTGVSRYCPVNQALGIDNYGKGEKERPSRHIGVA